MSQLWLSVMHRLRTIEQRTAILLGLFPTVGILMLNGFWTAPLFQYSPTLYWTIDILSHFIVPLIVLYGLAKMYRLYPAGYGFIAPGGVTRWADLIGLTLIVGAMLWISYVPVSAMLGQLFGSELSAFTYFNVLPESGATRVLVGIYFSVSAGLFEEIMYRALPWVYFSKLTTARTPVVSYAFVSSILFGFAHWENGVHEICATFVLGFVACMLYAKIRNIWPFVIAHTWIDLTAFL